MLKGIIVFILLMTVAATAFAFEDKVVLANIDKDFHPLLQKREIAPGVTEKYEYYEIRGDSEKTLRSQMIQNNTTWNDGKKYDSLTSWLVKWDYGYDGGPQACSADSFRTTIEITFRFPKWVRTDDAPPALVAKWDGYMEHLITHENGHRDMAVRAAAELSRAVAQLPPAASCADLDREVLVLSRARMKKLNADEKEYDAATSHGITQGAIFP